MTSSARRRWIIGSAALAAFALPVLGAALSRVSRHEAGDDVRATIARQADSLDAALVLLAAAIDRTSPSGDGDVDSTSLASPRAAFRHARSQFKRLEGAAEFYAPALAAALNSRRGEIDDDDAPPPSTMAPSGFPALEGMLWPAMRADARDSARTLVAGMRRTAARLRAFAPAIIPTDAQVVELTRLELVRISTLGIAGFDAPRSGDGARESAEAVEGIRELYRAASSRWPAYRTETRGLDSALAATSAYLAAHSDWNSFDRLAFLVRYEEPAARALDRVRRAVIPSPIQMRRALRADAASAYVANAFDPRAYAPNTAPPSSDALVDLGRRLFFEPALSGDGTRSCASCHRPERAFTDGLVRAAGLRAHGASVARNTPSLINAALQPAQLADERAVTLEDQVVDVLRNVAEMGSSVDRAAATLGRSAAYRARFAQAFHDNVEDVVSPLRLRQALAAYMRTLVALNSRFDRAVRGDEQAVSDEERRGFNLFMGRAGCGTCHFAPLFGGTAPPLYVGSDVEVIGTPASPSRLAVLDADSGRARIDHRADHLRAFKVPSLRNVAVTAPYMHHGTFATLDDVLRFYDGGGARGAGARLSNQTLAGDSLHLTTAERSAIVAFLGTLTDTARITRAPSSSR